MHSDNHTFYVTCKVSEHQSCYVGETVATSSQEAAANVMYRIRDRIKKEKWSQIPTATLKRNLVVHTDLLQFIHYKSTQRNIINV